MEKRIASPTIVDNHAARSLIIDLEKLEVELGIQNGIIYYEFPLFRDETDHLYRPHMALASRSHGLILFEISNDPASADQKLGQLDSVIYAKLLKSPLLRKRQREIAVPITSIIFTTHELEYEEDRIESHVASSRRDLSKVIADMKCDPLADDQWGELVSLIEGGKGIVRPKERSLSGLRPDSKAAILARIEGEIANFDRDQRLAAITLVKGPQRIRGLAGSGKTIVLAMKAAHIHLDNPKARVLFTFWTRSLYDLAKQLITRFYRQFDDRDPDWTQLHVLHAWGGRRLEGVYYNACIDNGRMPLTLQQARRAGSDPFSSACEHLLSGPSLKPKYDYILIDEGQDFPPAFYRLCFQLAKGGEHDRNLIWAYDELQTIMETDIQNVAETFGTDESGTPLIDLQRAEDRSKGILPHDIVLHSCYRNPPEILVTAHALGFGIYSEEGMVQGLENREHWEDLGYVVEKGDCLPGQDTVVFRPEENSPLSLAKYVKREDIIQYLVANDFREELKWIHDQIGAFIEQGLSPEDILVICFDDRNARAYFGQLAERLANDEIAVNSVLDQAYVEPLFSIPNHVTLSTVYRAKGNEAAAVIGVGLDAMYPLRNVRKGRNRLFTVLTRAKAWLRLSGIGQAASLFTNELETALQNFPRMRFVYPDRKNIDMLQRDWTERSAKIMEMQKVIQDLGLSDLSDQELLQMVKGVQKKAL